MSSSGDSADLDLIRRVQDARMRHDADAIPSQVGGVYWIEAKRQADGPGPTARAGHFVLRCSIDEVDAAWATLKAATLDGRLGYKSKVATAGRTPASRVREIHVVTYDADDAADIARVRAALDALGFSDAPYVRQT